MLSGWLLIHSLFSDTSDISLCQKSRKKERKKLRFAKREQQCFISVFSSNKEFNKINCSWRVKVTKPGSMTHETVELGSGQLWILFSVMVREKEKEVATAFLESRIGSGKNDNKTS